MRAWLDAQEVCIAARPLSNAKKNMGGGRCFESAAGPDERGERRERLRKLLISLPFVELFSTCLADNDRICTRYVRQPASLLVSMNNYELTCLRPSSVALTLTLLLV